MTDAAKTDAAHHTIALAAPADAAPDLPSAPRSFAVGTGRLEVIRGALARGDYAVDLSLLAQRLLRDELG